MPDSVVMEPPTHRTITHTLQIRTDAQFAADYDRYAEVCRAIYNRAVHEAALDGPERRTYAPYKPKERVDEKGGVNIPHWTNKQASLFFHMAVPYYGHAEPHGGIDNMMPAVTSVAGHGTGGNRP